MEKLVRLPTEGEAVFVGDTHGDFDASRLVIKNYLRRNNVVVFLGDYVDRGPASQRNIDYLLEVRRDNPNVILLAGNHEMYPVVECRPCDFWDGMKTEPEALARYRETFLDMPLAVEGNGFIALHGVPPDLANLEDINRVEVGDVSWNRLLWGDFRDKPGEYLGDFLGRPKYGRDYFSRVMDALKKNVLVRSHDPLAPERLFKNRCLTIFTSCAYGRDRKIAVLDLSRKVKDIDDFNLISF